MERTNKLVLPVAIITTAAISLAGGAMFNTLQANAATATTMAATQNSGSSSDDNTNAVDPPDPSQGGHVGSNGTKEELLTGDTADKVKAAALAAVPGGTVQRVENDAEGATYEAHMTKSDGTRVTVKFDSNFKVTSTENGMGMR